MTVDSMESFSSVQESFPMRTSVSSSDCQHRVAMSWPGVRDTCIYNIASKSFKTAGIDHYGPAAAGEQTGHIGGEGTLLSISSRHLMTWTLSSCEASTDYMTTCRPADPDDTEMQTPNKAHRAYSAPSSLEVDAMLAPQTPPMLRQLVYLSPPDSPPSARLAVRSPNQSAQLRSQGTSPQSSTSQLQFPSHHHHYSERQGSRVGLPRPASLLSAAFERYVGDCSNSISNFMDLHQACYGSPSVNQDAKSSMRSISSDGFDGNADIARLIVPDSSNQPTEGAEWSSRPATAITLPITPAPKASSPDLHPFLQDRPTCMDSALLTAAAPLDYASTTATPVSNKTSDDKNTDADTAPVLLPPYDLSRSALWHVGLPRGRPPLPPGSCSYARRVSLSSTLSADLRLISTPLAHGDESDSPYAAAGTGHDLAAGFGTPLSLSGAAASPFGRTPDPLAASAFSPIQDFDADAAGYDVSGSHLCWGGSNWTQRTSPFASLSQQEEDPRQENEDWHTGVMDMDVEAAALFPDSRDEHLVGSGSGPGACEGVSVESAAVGMTAAPMDDDELDDYYLNTLCGGCDPLAAFMQQERLRMQEQAEATTAAVEPSVEVPSAAATQSTSGSSSGEALPGDIVKRTALALTAATLGGVDIELRGSMGQGQHDGPHPAVPAGVLGLNGASAATAVLSTPSPLTSLLRADTPAVGLLGHLLEEHDGGIGLGCALEPDVEDGPFEGLIEASSSPRVFEADAHVLLTRITAPRAGCGAGGAAESPSCVQWCQTGYSDHTKIRSQYGVCPSDAADGVDKGDDDGSVFCDVQLRDDKAARVVGNAARCSEHLSTPSHAVAELLTAALHAEAAAAPGPAPQVSLLRGDSRCHFHAVEVSASCAHCRVADDVQQLVEAVVLGACFSVLEEEVECVWE